MNFSDIARTVERKRSLWYERLFYVASMTYMLLALLTPAAVVVATVGHCLLSPSG